MHLFMMFHCVTPNLNFLRFENSGRPCFGKYVLKNYICDLTSNFVDCQNFRNENQMLSLCCNFLSIIMYFTLTFSLKRVCELFLQLFLRIISLSLSTSISYFQCLIYMHLVALLLSFDFFVGELVRAGGVESHFIN